MTVNSLLPARVPITPQQVGWVWEIIVRNYYVMRNYATFRVAGSGPPCDLIAFQPPPNFGRGFPIRTLERSNHLESLARKLYQSKFDYLPDLMPSLLDGFYLKEGHLSSLQVHLLALGPDHIRFIWTRRRTKKRAYRIWDKKIENISKLELIECKAVKKFNIDSFRKSEQFIRQFHYAEKVHARYVTVHKTDKGAERFIHLTDKSISVGFIIEWDKLFRSGGM